MTSSLGGEQARRAPVHRRIMSAPYFDLIREMKDHHHFRLVALVRQHGIKATAGVFQTTIPTVRKWSKVCGAAK